jgi:hypothetical protein
MSFAEVVAFSSVTEVLLLSAWLQPKSRSPNIKVVSLMCFISYLSFVRVGRFTMGNNVLQLQEVGDFGDENCLPPLNLIRSTKFHLTTEPPLLPNVCVCPHASLERMEEKSKQA